MKIKTFHMKIISVRENENFPRKCELLCLLVQQWLFILGILTSLLVLCTGGISTCQISWWGQFHKPPSIDRYMYKTPQTYTAAGINWVPVVFRRVTLIQQVWSKSSEQNSAPGISMRVHSWLTDILRTQ